MWGIDTAIPLILAIKVVVMYQLLIILNSFGGNLGGIVWVH